MEELNELEGGIEELKKRRAEQARSIETLNAEKRSLVEKSRSLESKLHDTNIAYEQSLRKVMEFVNSQVSDLRLQINDLKLQSEKMMLESLSKQESSISAVLEKQRQEIQKKKESLEKHVESGIESIRREIG